MKQMKTILMTATMVLLAFSGVLYTSCHKDPCKGVACYNGGTCSGGSCLCPAGYIGSHCQNLATTTVTYQNNTHTTVYFQFNDGSNYSIPPGQTLSFDGLYGDDGSGTAYTSGEDASGYQVGLKLSWDFGGETFPASGTDVVDIDVSSDYFFLYLVNNSPYVISQEYVNYGLTSQTYDNVSIPNDGNTYTMGYYDAYTNSNLYLETASGAHYWSYGISLSFGNNASYTFTAY